jgi:hypothetical protein
MNKIKYLTIFSFLFLGGCFAPYERVDEFEKYKAQVLVNISPEKRDAVRFAKSCDFGNESSGKCGFGYHDFDETTARHHAREACVRVYRNCRPITTNNWETLYQKQIVEKKIDSYIQQCEYIGFKRNTEKMGECVLKINQTEKQIVNTQSNNSSGDTLANLIILQESLKLLQPPTNPRRNVQCTYNTVGGILGVNCF